MKHTASLFKKEWLKALTYSPNALARQTPCNSIYAMPWPHRGRGLIQLTLLPLSASSLPPPLTPDLCLLPGPGSTAMMRGLGCDLGVQRG